MKALKKAAAGLIAAAMVFGSADIQYIPSLEAVISAESGSVVFDGGILRWDPVENAHNYIVRMTCGDMGSYDYCYANYSEDYRNCLIRDGMPEGTYTFDVYYFDEQGNEVLIGSTEYEFRMNTWSPDFRYDEKTGYLSWDNIDYANDPDFSDHITYSVYADNGNDMGVYAFMANGVMTEPRIHIPTWLAKMSVLAGMTSGKKTISLFGGPDWNNKTYKSAETYTYDLKGGSESESVPVPELESVTSDRASDITEIYISGDRDNIAGYVIEATTGGQIRAIEAVPIDKVPDGYFCWYAAFGGSVTVWSVDINGFLSRPAICDIDEKEPAQWDPNFSYNESTGILSWDSFDFTEDIKDDLNLYNSFINYNVELTDTSAGTVTAARGTSVSVVSGQVVGKAAVNLPLWIAQIAVNSGDNTLSDRYAVHVKGYLQDIQAGFAHIADKDYVYDVKGGRITSDVSSPAVKNVIRSDNDMVAVHLESVGDEIGYLISTGDNGISEISASGTSFQSYNNGESKVKIWAVDKNGNISLPVEAEVTEKETKEWDPEFSFNEATGELTWKNADCSDDPDIADIIPYNVRITNADNGKVLAEFQQSVWKSEGEQPLLSLLRMFAIDAVNLGENRYSGKIRIELSVKGEYSTYIGKTPYIFDYNGGNITSAVASPDIKAAFFCENNSWVRMELGNTGSDIIGYLVRFSNSQWEYAQSCSVRILDNKTYIEAHYGTNNSDEKDTAEVWAIGRDGNISEPTVCTVEPPMKWYPQFELDESTGELSWTSPVSPDYEGTIYYLLSVNMVSGGNGSDTTTNTVTAMTGNTATNLALWITKLRFMYPSANSTGIYTISLSAGPAWFEQTFVSVPTYSYRYAGTVPGTLEVPEIKKSVLYSDKDSSGNKFTWFLTELKKPVTGAVGYIFNIGDDYIENTDIKMTNGWSDQYFEEKYANAQMKIRVCSVDGKGNRSEWSDWFTADDLRDGSRMKNIKLTYNISRGYGWLDAGIRSDYSESDGIAELTIFLAEGDDAELNIETENGYIVSDIIIDGKSVGAADSYLFENITADHTVNIVFEIAEKKLIGISLIVPDKVTYYENETLDAAGGKVKLIYENGAYELRDMTADMVTGFSSGSLGKQTLTVKYEDFTAAYEITVIEPVSDIISADDNLGGAEIDGTPEALSYALNEEDRDAEQVKLVVDEKSEDSIDADVSALAEETVSGISDKVVTEIGMFIDISIEKYAEGEKIGNIEETAQPVKIRLEIPETLLKDDDSKARDYKILRIHNGIAELLEAVFDGTNISFETDKFSDYAIVYTDLPYGDSNGDGEVTMADLLLLKQYMVKVPGKTVYKAASDVTADNDVTMADLLRLKQYMVKVPGVKLGK